MSKRKIEAGRYMVGFYLVERVEEKNDWRVFAPASAEDSEYTSAEGLAYSWADDFPTLSEAVAWIRGTE